MDPVAGAVAAVVCALLALGTPRVVGALPPPARPEGEAPEEGVPTYAEVAARPGLAVRAALAAAVAGALGGAATGWGTGWALVVVLVPVGTALAIVDWATRLLPTRLVAPSYAAVLAVVLVGALVEQDVDDLVRAALGWAALGGLYFVLWFVHPRGLGYGDVRLSGVLGIALGSLGWAELVVGGYAGFLLGGVGGGLLALLGLVQRRAVPFGPFMLVGALLGVVAGPALAAWAA